MRAFLIFTTLVVVAVARPDIGLQIQQQQQNHPGYNYEPNRGGSSGGGSRIGHLCLSEVGGGGGQGSLFEGISSYEAPLVSGNIQSGSTASGYSGGASRFSGPSNGGQQSFGGSSGQQQSFGGSSGQQQSFGGSSGQQQGFRGSSGQQQSFGGSSRGQQQSFGGSSSGSYSSGGSEVSQGETRVIDLSGGASSGGVIYKPVIKQGEPIISKHFYVHEAPEDATNVRIEEKEQIVRPQKHYKIIFIKAPAGGGGYSANNYAVYPQNEEKTIVYVLSKKEEASFENGEIPTPPPAVTSKPEVFFVKYNKAEDTEKIVSKVQESFQEGGAGYYSPGAFADSIGALSSGGSANSFDVRTNAGSSGSGSSGSGSSSGSSSYSSGQSSQQSFQAPQQVISTPQQSYSTQTQQQSYNAPQQQSYNTQQQQSYNAPQQQQQPQQQSFQKTQTSFSSGAGYASGDQGLIVAQKMLEIPSEDSAFNSIYLPPGKK